MKTKATALLLAILILTTFTILTACKATPNQDPEQQATSAELIPAGEIGEGSVTFRFEVTDDTGTIKAWNVNTNHSIVGDALLEVGLISGDVGSLGLMVTEVNGLTADYMVNESWWAFYISGEFAMTGVDSTDIEFGRVYAFVYTIG